MFPPGRGKLATKPLPTGSETITKTMGMVRVCCGKLAVVGVLCERMRSGCSAISSFANRCINAASDCAPAVFDPYVAADGPAQLGQPRRERLQFALVALDRAHEPANAPPLVALLRLPSAATPPRRRAAI